ncbi:Nuclear poly [Talaromyces pinophilus]|nr:Nuclear poly [Talaromyces pinophilus]
MASPLEESSDLSLNSFDTALCIIPPAHLTQDINRLRALYDKAYEKWPPHINLIYPFVDPEDLPHVVEIMRSTLAKNKTWPFQFVVDKAGFFTHKRHRTIYTTSSGKGREEVKTIRRDVLSALGQADTHFQPHLTIGQSEANDESDLEYLISKASLLPLVEWEVSEVVILIREKTAAFSSIVNHMRVWGNLNLSGEYPLTFPNATPLSNNVSSIPNTARLENTFQFDSTSSDKPEAHWKRIELTSFSGEAKHTQRSLSVSSYNILVDATHPLSTGRYPVILGNLLQSSSIADILVLQEVSDSFLSFLLNDDNIRSQYPFSSHGPPEQSDIGPLPSLRNIVVLSRWKFRWEWLTFEKPHKGSVVLQFEDIGVFRGNKFHPLIVAGVHLTCGLTDASISVKHTQVRTVIGHLQTQYPDNNWIIAGDFNIPSSSYTIDVALERNSITARGAATLSSLDILFAESKLTDCYFGSRATGSYLGRTITNCKEKLRTVYEGEEGATYDPIENSLAANNSGKSYHCRPQRYDRIYTKGEGFLVTCFNLFGLPTEEPEGRLGSDHWGVRATLDFDDSPTRGTPSEHDIFMSFKRAPQNLTSDTIFNTTLHDLKMFPSEEEFAHRQQMFELVKIAIQQRNVCSSVETRLNISFAVVPVGSYGLGVWDTSSDIDCLVIGTISPKTFIALMVQKLRRPGWQEIHILRKVKAASGTMLEIQAGGVRFDLQYCAATCVAESWPKALNLPSSDSIFDLPMQSLLKLNSIRDLEYLQRTIPDLATFRKAYRFIKTWARCRGIYSSKLGYLGGIHITLLLARVCKVSFRQAGAASVSDILSTFFTYYANFDWKNDMVYDTTFYTAKPKYHRSYREPMVILSIHPPKVNVAHASTVLSLNTLEREFKRAAGLIFDTSSTWKDIAGPTSIVQFFESYYRYIKVDVHYWAKAAAKGRALFGWLEFRCVSLLVDINRGFPNIHARIWPARFTEMEEEAIEGMEEYQGCLVIGLSKSEKPSTNSLNESDRQSAHISLISLLQKFAEQVRADESYFDRSCSWIDVSLAKSNDLRNLRLDASDWSHTTGNQAEEFDSDDEFEQDYDDTLTVQTAANTESFEQWNLPARSSRPPPAAEVVGGPRLRPADDVLNRLRWDASFDSSDYVVGYVDRFIGEKEMPIDRWKSEQTHEEFIPMHRVLYFKRKSDGERVWDREKRIDLIFNTGATNSRV